MSGKSNHEQSFVIGLPQGLEVKVDQAFDGTEPYVPLTPVLHTSAAELAEAVEAVISDKNDYPQAVVVHTRHSDTEGWIGTSSNLSVVAEEIMTKIGDREQAERPRKSGLDVVSTEREIPRDAFYVWQFAVAAFNGVEQSSAIVRSTYDLRDR